MFFVDNNSQFFRPLTSKYREVVIECLRLFYLRLYSSLADYGHAVDRQQLLDTFQEAIARAPILEGDDDDDAGGRFRSERDLAVWILNSLIEFGWIERQMDEATLKSTFGFTRQGRMFTQPFIDIDTSRIRTRHRNTRNTRNSLHAFVELGDVNDLLDAYEYSERIISDFTDVIAELDERKRQLVKEVEAHVLVQKASDDFFDFMEKRFQPDIAVRLSADSVEKHRDEISDTIVKIRRKRKQFKADAERKLRQVFPDGIVAANQSYLYFVLDIIESRLKNACDIMLPSLRKALQSFTQRADIIIRQMSFLSQQRNDDLVSLCKALSELPDIQQSPWLDAVAQRMETVSIGFVDPAHIKLTEAKEKRVVNTSVMEIEALDKEARKQIFVQQAVDRAFTINDQEVRKYLMDALGKGARVSTRHLPIITANDFLSAVHAIEVGSVNNLDSEFQFRVEGPIAIVENEDNGYLRKSDEYFIELIERG
ncbi:flagellar protein FliT [Gammaproteobacteria bacterium 45_16_T64]|nr:flagellar protein FliT [Gammaproteobacteria bacterium 45_16_T64]